MEEKTFGERLKELRKKYLLTQEALASELFVSPKTVSKWEKDRGMPSVDLLISISKFFKVNLDYLLLGEGKVEMSTIEVGNSEKMKKIRYCLPSVTDFPEPVRETVLEYFIREYAKVNNLDERKFLREVEAMTRPKTFEDSFELFFNMERVSTSKTQRYFSIGFAKAGKIKDKLTKDGFITLDSDKLGIWVNKDKEKIREIIKQIIEE